MALSLSRSSMTYRMVGGVNIDPLDRKMIPILVQITETMLYQRVDIKYHADFGTYEDGIIASVRTILL